MCMFNIKKIGNWVCVIDLWLCRYNNMLYVFGEIED